MDARCHVWEGAIPLSLQLHPSEVTTMPAPPELLIMAPRNGYLPLLTELIRPHFQSALPPGDETLWFDFKGLPLKWHIPTGVLFDLLCLEPERPWNLTVHFRAYPSELLSPYEGSEAAKWNFMNTLKEASYIMYGSTKSVMNMTQKDQKDLWRSIVEGDMEEHDRIAVRLGSKGGSGETDVDTARPGSESLGKVPIRLYVRVVKGSLYDTFGVPPVESWNEVMTMTRPVEVPKFEGQVFTLGDALLKIVPQFFLSSPQESKETSEVSGRKISIDEYQPVHIRIQGIEPKLDLPLEWIARNLAGHEHFTHICMWVFEIMESSGRRHIRCIVKLGGAAITFKDKLETINEDILFKTALQLQQAMGGITYRMDWSRQEEQSDIPAKTDLQFPEMHAFVVVHGAGSFGHFQASISGVNKGGLGALFVNAGFVATRISVTKLNHEVVRALALEGIPVVGVSPFAAGWSTHNRILDCDNVPEVRRIVDAGFVPVLHGDAVRDTHQGCSILSGDVIIRRLAEDLQTNVPGVFDRPPSEEGAVLLQEIVVFEDGQWTIARPKIETAVRTTLSSHDTTGGMAAKIAEAASISKLGIDVYIVEAGTEHALQALKGSVKENPESWVGTIVRSASSN